MEKTAATERPPAKPAPVSTSRIRARAFLLGGLIIIADNYWVLMIERVLFGPYPTLISLFANAVFILTVLVLLNPLLKRGGQQLNRLLGTSRFRPELSAAEMLLVYTMVAVGAALAGLDMMSSLVITIGHPWWFASPENQFATTFLPYMPKWLTVSDKTALKGFYLGGSSLYADHHWLAWLTPALWWVGFTVVLIFVMMCINSIVRKQWADRERLTFPIVQLPVAMTDPDGTLWRNRLFWIGFGISFGIDLINGLAFYFPNIPTIPVGYQGHDLAQSFAYKPWNAISWTPYTFYPFVIGLSYLLPADLSFSCWFFYIFWKLQMVVSSAMAWDAVPDFPYVRHQSFGGYVAVLVTLTWTSRNYLRQVWLKLTDRKSELDDSDEAMSYRAAAAGAVLGFLLLALFMKQVGMSPWIAITAFAIYFVLATAIARMRAELGPPAHDLHHSGPDFMITTSMGVNHLSNGDLVGLTFVHWFNRAYRAHPMPIGIEGMRMAQLTRSSQRKFLWAVLLAGAVGGLATFWAFLHIAYNYGLTAKMATGSYYGNEAFRALSQWWTRPPDLLHPNWGANIAMVQGFAFCIMLGVLRLKFFGFPFHPIGYAISSSWSMNMVWSPIAIAWLLKVITLRYGGLRLYRIAVPFFFGLILGGMIIGCLWSLIGLTFHIPHYSFWGA